MKAEERPSAAVAPALALFTLMFTPLSVIAWIEALDFDPCSTTFRRAGAPCLQPGIGGIVVGGFFIFIGLSIAWGAVRNGHQQYGRWLEPLLFAWFGLNMAMVGAAAAYAQWSLGLS